MNPADAMSQCLREGAELLEALDDESYRVRVAQVMDASVGGHYRHALDHFRILLESGEDGLVDYDRRERATAVEHDRTAALEETRRLVALVERLPDGWAERRVIVRTLALRANGAVSETQSTSGREAVFCVLHAVHHHALIRVICGHLGRTLPVVFGIAPATVAAMAETPGAPAAA